MNGIKRIKKLCLILCIYLTTLLPQKAFAWGPEGHAIVGRLAMRFVNDDVRQNVLKILGAMTIDTATNWMDIVRSNADYDYMKSWHYIDFPKTQPYAPSNTDNIINRLMLTYSELTHKKLLCDAQIRTDLLVLLHLIGDLHMPLHTAYDDDLGGNKKMVQYGSLKTHNLHTFWDIDIIELGQITDSSCLTHFNTTQKDTTNTIDYIGWMNENRAMLDDVYNFPDFSLNEAYLLKNKVVVEKQLLKAGLRMAMILNKLFYDQKKLLDYKKITATFKNGIDISAVDENVEKKVTICNRIFTIKYLPSITQISLGEAYPKNKLTIIVFAKNYANFTMPIEDYFKDKDVCVTGKITEYKGKKQIIIESPNDIEFK